MKTTTFQPNKLPGPGLTLEQFCDYIAPRIWDKRALLDWPPDVFAVVASLLLKSGSYCHAVSGSRRPPSLNYWVKQVRKVGRQWRSNPKKPPNKIAKWYATLTSPKVRALPIFTIRDNRIVCDALLRLCAAADEACSGVGFAAIAEEQHDAFLGEASEQLLISGKVSGASTLCKKVHESVLRVLPKLHTPQSGITIRSLTHHLALCPAGDVRAKWAERPRPRGQGRRDCLNLLLAPWPVTVSPAHFRRVYPEDEERDLPERFGLFEYKPPTEDSIQRLKGLLKQARKIVKTIDGVIFPELALTRQQYRSISTNLMSQGIFLICGIRESSKNYLRMDIPVDLPHVRNQVMWHEQSKHHRWALDKRQIIQYGLGSCLNVDWKWWEHTTIDERKLNFVVLDDWLTICALICEDLARQDPVAEVVRAVGPNLVIALLMDGPQLSSRWPARYATVLADDPGSSVLTLTSVGMSELSRPPSIQKSSRSVALWKDAKTGEAISIELPQHSDGVILSLSCQFKNEWTADGRDDNCSTGYPTLSGIHFVSSGALTK